MQLELPPLLLPLLLPGTHQLGEAVLLLRQALLPFVLPVNLAAAAAPRARGAQEGRRAVAPPVVVAAAVAPVVVAAAAAVLVVAAAVLVVVAGVGPDQRRVAHAADDVLHPGPFGAEMLVRQSVQVEGGEGLRGRVGVVARSRRLPPEGGGGGRRGRPRGEAVGGAVSFTGGVAAAVLSLDLRAAAGQVSTPLFRKTEPEG